MLKFRNLDVTPDDPVAVWGVEGILAALERGGLAHVRRIVRAVEADPFGPVAADAAQAAALSPTPLAGLIAEIIERARDDDRQRVARRVRDAITRTGLSQRSIAQRLAIAPPLLSRYATGKTVPSAVALERIERLARAAPD